MDRAARDIAVVGIITAAAFFLAVVFDAFEQIADWSREYESWELDELLIPLVVLALGFVIFAARRWGDFKERTAELAAASELLRERETTLQQTMEELRLGNEELAGANAELEHFTYAASHDLQEPLRMVTGFVKLLERRYKGKLDAEADEFIAYAVDGADRMRDLINDLLTYSRIRTEGHEFKPVNSSEAFSRAVANLRSAITESGAAVNCGPLPVVTADLTQLTQLFQNLVSNAVKFREKDAPQVHVSARARAGEGLFSVRDQGIGIEPRHTEQIFHIFERLHGRGQYPGTGIGLSICKKIVERAGGRIRVESQPGEGATFFFTLPAAEGPPP